MKNVSFIATVCVLLTSSCSIMDSGYYFSQKVPSDVIVNQNAEERCISLGSGSSIFAVSKWPNTEESQKIFNEWWSHAKRMGTRPFLLPDNAPYRMYFSQQLWISFADDYYITYHYHGKKDVGPLCFRRTNKYDKALFQYLLKEIDKRQNISRDEAEILSKKCMPYFEYADQLRQR